MSTLNKNVKPSTAVVDNAIMSTMNPLELGTIVRSWAGQGSKGLDWIVIGLSATAKLVATVKANCINNDGSVRDNAKVRFFDYSTSPNASISVVKNITNIQGHKAKLKIQELEKFNSKRMNGVSALGFNSVVLYTPATTDRHKSSIYS